jgi:glyoxylase I family protein
MFAIDHLAYPCFDVAATSRFYTDVLGGTLRHAQSGPAPEWKANEYLWMAFELPGGFVIDFFSFDGVKRPPAGALPKDICHVALSVGTREEVVRFKDRLASREVPFWLETHDVDDVHVYTTDPNGVTLEILANQDSVRRRNTSVQDAKRVVARWMATRR